jgi:hypothetical protein
MKIFKLKESTLKIKMKTLDQELTTDCMRCGEIYRSTTWATIGRCNCRYKNREGWKYTVLTILCALNNRLRVLYYIVITIVCYE